MEFTPAHKNGHEIMHIEEEFRFPGIVSDAFWTHVFQVTAHTLKSSTALAGIIDVKGKCFKLQQGIPHIREVFEFAAGKQQFIADLTKNKAFSNNPLVANAPHFVSFYGFPIPSDEDEVVTLCIWDSIKNEITEEQKDTLQALADITGSHYEQAKKVAWQHLRIEELKTANADLDSFAGIAAHDLKSPLNAIISLTHLIKSNYGESLDEEGNEYIDFLGMAANNLAELISGIQKYSRSTQVLAEQKDAIIFTDLVEEVTALLEIPANVSIRYEKNDQVVHSSHIALMQILLNLVDNAIRYNDKEQVEIDITIEEEKNTYTITVKDNGPGITGYAKDKVFDLFKALQKKIKEKKDITIGLAIVKKLVEKLKGAIHMQSEEGEGTTFIITIPK